MEHSIKDGNGTQLKIEESESDKRVFIQINFSDVVILDKEKLHSVIGTLLHIQAKMRGGKNGNL